MKRLFAILLVVAMMASLATVASAAENTMVLKTTVPAASYTLSIPTTLEIPFGAEEVDFPLIEVVESSGFQGRDLRIAAEDPVFFGEETEGVSNIIVDMDLVAVPYAAGETPISLIRGEPGVDRAMYYIWAGDDGVLQEDCYMLVDGELCLLDKMRFQFVKEDWYKLPVGEHTGHIIFTSEVVPNVSSEN